MGRTLQILEPVTAVLKGILVLGLLLAAAVFALVGAINAEDWIFGTKLDGAPAFLYLIAKAVGGFALGCLLVRSPRRTPWIGVMTMAYFAYLFIDSTVTIRATTGGARQFSEGLLVLLAASILYVVSRAIAPLRDPIPERDGIDSESRDR